MKDSGSICQCTRLGKGWPSVGVSTHWGLIKWLLCAFRPVCQPQPLTCKQHGSIQLLSCQEDAHTVAMDETIRSACTECKIKLREFIAAGLTLSMVLGCLQSTGDRAETGPCPTCLHDLQDSKGTTWLGFQSPVF